VAGADRFPARVDTSWAFWPPEDQGTTVDVFYVRCRVFGFARVVSGRRTGRAFRHEGLCQETEVPVRNEAAMKAQLSDGPPACEVIGSLTRSAPTARASSSFAQACRAVSWCACLSLLAVFAHSQGVVTARGIAVGGDFPMPRDNTQQTNVLYHRCSAFTERLPVW